MLARSKGWLSICNFVVVMLAAFLFSGWLAVAASDDPPVLTDEQKKLVTAARNAVKAADQSILAAEQTRRSADSKTILISSLNSFEAADEMAMRNLEELAGAIRSVGSASLLPTLEENTNSLKKAKTDLTKAQEALPAEATGLPQEISAVRKECIAAQERLDQQTEAQGKAKTKLTAALGAVPPNVKALAELFPPRLAPLFGLDKDAKPDALLPALPEGIAGFTEVERRRRLLSLRWKNVSSALKLAGSEDAAKHTEVTKAIETVGTQTEQILRNLQPWLVTLKLPANDEAAKASRLLPELIKDPVKNGPEALSIIRDAAGLYAQLSRLTDAWTPLAAQLKGVSVPNFDLAKTSQSAQTLAEAAKSLNIAVSVLQDGLAGDAADFIADQVSLYYFSDVPRIMRILNAATYQVGGVQGARAQAALERRRLTETELDLAEAQAKVSAAQRSVSILQEELRQTKVASSSTEDVLRKASRSLQNIQGDHTKVQEKFDLAKAAAEADPANAEKRLAQERAAAELDRSSTRVTNATQRNEDATREREAAKDRHDAAANEQTGLPTRIQEAKDQLEVAQAAVTRQRRAAFLSAQAESDAFAFARDNTPFWFGPAIGSSTDPVKRVLMYAFDDSKTIFLRGKEADVEKVKDIIAHFDKPAPQARLTLWTMEMSSDTSPKGTERFNEALQIIEQELANNRALTTAALSFLRDCLNDEVNLVANAAMARFNQATLDALGADSYRLARLYFYQPEVVTRLGMRAEMLDPTRLATLNPEIAKSTARFTRLTIPDPAGTTTLGEALMVLSLGRHTQRGRVLDNFRHRLKDRLEALVLRESFAQGQDSWKIETNTSFFTSTNRALGLDIPGSTVEPLTSMQLEILHAAERLAVPRVTTHVRELLTEVQKIDNDVAGPAISAIRRQQLQARRNNLVAEIIPIINFLRTQFGFDPRTNFQASIASQVTATQINEVEDFIKAAKQLNPLRTANARVAAADQMLKDLIIAVEDDLDRHFVQRMLNRLRRRITKDNIGIGVGVMQRTSMLATNRLLARVDPRASAQLGASEEQNILEGVQQLAQIYLTAQTAGVLGVLGALDKQPREAPPEIYGINTGNVFKVTPIFDPSGQALKFKFDFVGATRIQEPDGTVSRQLPRIERHTVNTEVQLSNLELREISRFDANTRIGRPTEYSGGLPIIKDIPKVRPYLPLLAWFVRKGGKAAVVQQSLIFGQTTMYPTIGDIMDLLTTPITVR